MKLASLLAKFLYDHNRLDLPGIGTFTCSQATLPEDDSRRGKGQEQVNISFESNPQIKENTALIGFISSSTGKIKALAAADLDSHLELAKQFLNIGKPFLFEGIGSLVKKRPGEYSMETAEPAYEKTKAFAEKESSASGSENDYRSILQPKKEKTNWRKPAIMLLVAAGIGLAIWGGYTVYKITTSKNKAAAEKKDIPGTEQQNNQPAQTAVPPPAQTIQQPLPVPPAVAGGHFRFILENADSDRAYKRYTHLKNGCKWDVQISSTDSVNYTLYMILPASAADTSRIADSLSRLSGKRVFVGQ